MEDLLLHLHLAADPQADRQEHGQIRGRDRPGAVQIFFAAYAPRYTSGKHKGECETGNNVQPLAKGAVATFLAAGVLTVNG